MRREVIIVIIITLCFVPLKYELCEANVRVALLFQVFAIQQRVSPYDFTPLCVSFPLFLSHLSKPKYSLAHLLKTTKIAPLSSV